VRRTSTRAALAGLILATLAAPTVGCGMAAPLSPTADPRPDPPRPTTPPPKAGQLTSMSLPPAESIGPSFRPSIEPEAAEENVVSHGTLVHERDSHDVAASIAPLGCPGLDGLDPLPVPRDALELTYRTPSGRAAVALAVEYSSEPEAMLLVSGLARRLELCTTPASTDDLPVPRPVIDVRRHDASTVLDTRHEVGPDAAPNRWDETVVRSGRRVGLVIIERARDAPVSSQDQLVADLRRRLAR
jgi:hypothetical protein